MIVVIGERNEPSMESWVETFVLLRMARCGIYISVSAVRSTKIFGLYFNCHLGDFRKTRHGYSRSEVVITDEENSCKFEYPRMKTWVCT